MGKRRRLGHAVIEVCRRRRGEERGRDQDASQSHGGASEAEVGKWAMRQL